MAVGKNNDKKVSACVFSTLSFITAAVLVVLGVGAWKMGTGAVSMINKGLVEQKIYFPPSNPAFPKVAKYADSQVTTGAQAKIYAEDYLGMQSKLAAGGKTLSEVSAELAADPQNMTLQALQTNMFQLETSRTLLLVGGYAPWAQGVMMKNAGVAALVIAGVLALVGAAQRMRYMRS